MIDVQTLVGVRLAILIMDYSGGEDGDGYLVEGFGKITDGKLFLDRGTGTDFPIPDHTYGRIKPVTSEQTEVVGDAQFLLILNAGPKPDDGVEYIQTGLRLPGREDESA
jgi:hypothetical protein